MTTPDTNALVRALDAEAQGYADVLHRLGEIADGDDVEGTPESPELHDLAQRLRNGAELLRVLRRLVAGRSRRELHDAFGAPGDWGYDTPLGDALHRLYRGKGGA